MMASCSDLSFRLRMECLTETLASRVDSYAMTYASLSFLFEAPKDMIDAYTTCYV